MSLALPLWLLLLLLLPLLALAQRWRRGQGTAYAVRFPAVATVALALAEEGRARWPRALPVVALLGAIAAIVLLSDGAANIGVSPVAVAAQAKHDHVAIYTVALGTPGGVLYQGAFNEPVAVPPDPRLMAQIARTSGGRAYDAQTANNLSSIYKTLGQRLSTVKRKRDVTIYALALAAVLLMIAIVASARTAARLP